jgi:adenine-specific DNA-methyltransferase
LSGRPRLGICEYITKPRLVAAVTGKRLDGEPVAGDYKFNDEYPIADGLQENFEFLELSYEDPDRVRLDYEFAAIAPLLWMRAGSVGRRVDERCDTYALADTYGVLFDVDHAEPFVAAVTKGAGVRLAFIVTDNASQYQTVAEALPQHVAPVRLYESYLRAPSRSTPARSRRRCATSSRATRRPR